MRECIREIWDTGAVKRGHAGLLYGAWHHEQGGDDRKKLEVVVAAARSARESRGYAHFVARRSEFLEGMGARLARVTFDEPVLIGTGLDSGAEVGLTLHHTWGLPLIPGSALKGLAAHYTDATYGRDNRELSLDDLGGDDAVRAAMEGPEWDGRGQPVRVPGDVYQRLFGTPEVPSGESAALVEANHDEIDERASTSRRGLLCFDEALIEPGPDAPIRMDVIAAHHAQFHQSSGQPAHDYESVNVISFLSVPPGATFLVSLRGPDDVTTVGASLLRDALSEWGIGARTSSGYGRARKWVGA